jgi:hypothetical protein
MPAISCIIPCPLCLFFLGHTRFPPHDVSQKVTLSLSRPTPLRPLLPRCTSVPKVSGTPKTKGHGSADFDQLFVFFFETFDQLYLFFAQKKGDGSAAFD